MNTIQTEIERLTKAKSDIKTAIINKGGTISDTATIDTYASAIDGISGGGGKKLKINVVTLNPEHRFGDMYILCYMSDENSLYISPFNCDDQIQQNSLKSSNGVTITSIEVEPKTYQLAFKSFKGLFNVIFATMAIYKGDVSNSTEVFKDEFYTAIYGPDVNDIEALKTTGYWSEKCKELTYDGTTDCYTIVFDFSYKDVIYFPLSVNFSVRHVNYPDGIEDANMINKTISFKTYKSVEGGSNFMQIGIDNNIPAFFNGYSNTQNEYGISSLWLDIVTYGEDEITTFNFNIAIESLVKGCVIINTYLNDANNINSAISDGNFKMDKENHVITVSFTPQLDTTVVGGFVVGV